MDTAVCLFLLVCIFKHGEGWGGRERGRRGGSRQRQRVSLSSGQEKKKKVLFFARSLALQESQIASVSWYPLLFLPFLCCNLAPSFLSFILFFLSLFGVSVERLVPAYPPPPPILNSSFYCGVWSFWLAGCRVTMSVGKRSLSRMPRSLWQSNSPMKPYQ